ncbi:hypothetical protein QEH52_11990 [Coraliomargarita sp. SDUM461003]|uniref:Uncharacterized protein n=1 Tax=Thalassobacterium maritimum TaxID=3041265 RepID=A0ABU1AVP4_9BACT|nr:hypothetical protein [Coraliomargarita sp. SDUM461003]MDQ8208234.1 hypothetical protein [Coraliomargarita sp. SDUM461003]
MPQLLAKPNENVENFIARWQGAEAAEEAKEKIIWLSPEYQCPEKAEDRGQKPEQTELAGTEPATSSPPAKCATQPWPKDLPNQVAAIHALLPETGLDAKAIAPPRWQTHKKSA